MCGVLTSALSHCLPGYPGWSADLRRAERWVTEFCASHGVGRRLIARGKRVIWLGAVLVAMAVVPAFYVESSRVALALICFGLVCYSGEGFGVLYLAHGFVSRLTVSRRCGAYSVRWGVSAGAVLGLLAGFMIQERGL